ncbi:glycine cleavage system P-protein [Dethiosulfovibrio peptidovorans DSM 11002]|uniref:Glycine cleavage system P-protein n=1 Tax=Dethiosulfovibrio peptidovorans DSM 11002 TaxID=469381 RepID=D2Z8V7_9BACT|nr:aminomethyl-transferring glycine dehydrogenase subunit GcvPA [Dethiosulfovibrio peptidovorans]EFC91904.1 glycine cleavage system P-protein [Dethiosulfovibrio peptidovorans DSM 11002]
MKKVYPYIPNSAPEAQKEMLEYIGVQSIDDLLVDIPKELRIRGGLKLPRPCLSEAELRRHMDGIIDKNIPAGRSISFLGAGCYNHQVPAVVDEVVSSAEFLTAYAGEPYEDHGRFQALFEYQSMMAELLDVDVCNVPTYDGAQAAATSLRMASRVSGRNVILLAGAIDPDRRAVIETYLDPVLSVEYLGYDEKTGLVNPAELKEILNDKVAAVYVENPSFLGSIEERGASIAQIAHDEGALFVVYVDPSSLGVLTPPSRYGADISCGDIQSLGIHMNYGTGGGFIATKDDPRIVEEYPSRLFSLAPTSGGEWGFGDVLWERTSFANRETAKEFVGTHSALWGIGAGVYLATMGPRGMEDLGRGIMQRSLYAKKRLSEIPGVSTDRFGSVSFKEFVVDFNHTGKCVKDINEYLLGKGIFGGKDISSDFKELGQCALFCVTEMISAEDIDFLVETLRDCLG